MGISHYSMTLRMITMLMMRWSYVQGMVQWMQKHARVLTTPSTPEGRVAGPSLPEEVEQLHSAESAASEASYWPVSQPSPHVHVNHHPGVMLWT